MMSIRQVGLHQDISQLRRNENIKDKPLKRAEVSKNKPLEKPIISRSVKVKNVSFLGQKVKRVNIQRNPAVHSARKQAQNMVDQIKQDVQEGLKIAFKTV